MAYRLPSDRKDRPSHHQTPSYLSDFLDHIQTLPATTKATLTTIRTLDDRISTTLSDAQTASQETIRRATTKQPLDAVKRQYHDFIHLHATLTEFTDNKLTAAEHAVTSIDDVLTHLDAKLALFEKQLRREGRWPGAPSPPPLLVDAPRHSPPPVPPPVQPREKKRRREREQPRDTRDLVADRARDATTPNVAPVLPNPATPRAAALAARVEAAAAAAAALAKEEEVVLDGGDAGAVDTTLYCICRNISHGQMVGCEGKNCVIEWFHFKCVGLTEEPKGTWYCPDCRKKTPGGRRKG